VVVTGAAGFIGSHVCEALARRGDDVLAIDGFVNALYSEEPKRRNWGELVAAGIECVEADLRFAEIEPLVTGADAVINLAAVPGLAPSWTNFEAYSTCNLSVVERLARAAVSVDLPRLVQVSTSSVYGSTATGDEASPTHPVSPYGVTKLAAESLLEAYREVFGVPAVVARYFSIYGPRQRPDMAYHRFISALLEDKPITIYGDGLQTRTNTYVTDCVAGTLLALDKGVPGQAYNIGGGVSVSMLQVIEMLSEIVGRQARISFDEARPGDQRDTRADIAKAQRTLGYQPEVAPADGLRQQVEWQRDHQA